MNIPLDCTCIIDNSVHPSTHFLSANCYSKAQVKRIENRGADGSFNLIKLVLYVFSLK